MEAFSLLKYWRNSGTAAGGSDNANASTLPNSGATNIRTSTTTIVTAVSSQSSETDDAEDNDEGPFFDLEFTVPDDDEAVEHSKNEETDDEVEDVDSDVSDGDGDDDSELKFTLSSGSSGECTDPNVSGSPSDDLFFKGRLVPIEHSSTDLSSSIENNSKLHFPVSLVKSATKFRVMMLKLKKSKSNISENAEPKILKKDKVEKFESEKEGKEHNNFFAVKLKSNEMPVVSSLFVRENSCKNSTSAKVAQKQNIEESMVLDERRFSKETVQRYLKKVKPLYVRVSKRYGEKLKFSGQLSLSGAVKEEIAPPLCTAEKKTVPIVKNEKEITPEVAAVANVKKTQKESLPAGLRVVCKHLGKSRSASSAAVAAAPPGAVLSQRRDDSLLQQQDGIQSAILHCKRSFKASRDLECSILKRSDNSSGDRETCR